MKTAPFALLLPTLCGMFAVSASAEVTFTVSDTRPGETAVTQPTTSLGSVATTAPTTIFPTTFTITGLDLTSVGGTASETIAFDISYSATGGSAVAQVNGFGNISVTGGNDNQIDLGETLTATISLNSGSTTFGGTINLGLTSVTAGGVAADELWDVVHDGGTIAGKTLAGGIITAFASSSFVTLVTQDGVSGGDSINLQGFSVEISAVPIPAAPSSVALADFSYDPSDGSAEVSITGAANTNYKLVEADDLDFSNPDQTITLTGATVGTLDGGTEVTTDGSGNATVQFNLGTAKDATFLRAEPAT